MKKKLGWTDPEELAFLLIDKYPKVNPNQLNSGNLIERVKSLDEFGEAKLKPNLETLEELQRIWFEERTDMEPELGPFGEVSEEDSELDEDAYRDDRMVQDDDDDDDDSDSDEVSLEDAFGDEDDDEEEF